MTGREMFKRALILAGYTDSLGNISIEQRFNSRALTVINLIYSDLFYAVNGPEADFFELEGLECEINLPKRILVDIMPYGVTGMLAQSENDGDNQQLFMTLYNQKRAGINSKSHIKDLIPTPEY